MTDLKQILNKEQRVMRMMRMVLGSVVRDTTTGPGQTPILKPKTISDIKDCFALISARERELAKISGLEMNEKPHFTDEQPTAQVVPIGKIKVREKPVDGD